MSAVYALGSAGLGAACATLAAVTDDLFATALAAFAAVVVASLGLLALLIWVALGRHRWGIMIVVPVLIADLLVARHVLLTPRSGHGTPGGF